MRAPFWKGERAEHIVRRRLKQYLKDKALKAKRRRRKKKS